MATITATLIPRRPGIPLFLPQVPTPHPTPIPPQPAPAPGGLNTRRRLRAEIEELSEEEGRVESQWKDMIRGRGYHHLRIIGRLHTRQEEKNDAEEEASSTGSVRSGDQTSAVNEGENGSEPEEEADAEQETEQEQDLDASMEDLDDTDGRNDTMEESEEDDEEPEISVEEDESTSDS